MRSRRPRTWTTPDTTILCASYSGDTEETLACYESAGALGAHRVVVTTGGRLAELARADGVGVIPLPGGFQPRAALTWAHLVLIPLAAAIAIAIFALSRRSWRRNIPR